MADKDMHFYTLNGSQQGLILKSKVLPKPGIVFVGGIFKTDDPAVVNEMTELLKQDNIAAMVRHVSIKEANEKAKEKLATLGQAQKGTATSANSRLQAQEQLAARDAQLAAMAADPEAAAKLLQEARESDLMLTEDGTGKIAPPISEGVHDIDVKPQTVSIKDQQEKVGELSAKSMLNLLGKKE